LTRHEIEETVFTVEEIRQRVGELAGEINRDYEGTDLLLIGILKGAFIFLADLARRLTVPVRFDFIACSSYGSSTRTSGVVRILKDLDSDISGKHVLLVEDIVDTGLTLSYLVKNLEARGPDSLHICTLLNKSSPERKADLPIRYQGFSIPDDFVIGYGLDCAEEYRNLPYIAKIRR